MDISLGLLTIGSISLLAAMSPGPDFAVVLKNSIFGSRRAGLFTSLGVSAGIFVHVTYTVLGIALIISQSIFLFSIIKYLGAAYLLYLGIQLLRTKRGSMEAAEGDGESVTISDWNAFRDGFLTNALNPKATLFFLSIFTQIIGPQTPLYLQGVYGAEVALIVLAWFITLSILFTTGIAKGAFARFHYYLAKVMGVALLALGIKVAFATQDHH
ncbi:hypothetical protein COU17_02975 [Candidatus Kaiserbacteria bacterium CG10_big_fil_rev_8_21_14_0_10_49_17]|uniref:Amino acid transporter n=1 Tax=Candidatus Kaiserbacteria bacterium CG10_big_fil_rev_8_21_14_0_10_49_17 TaxID=1974609 RepID=A0A2M6WDS7_9BACT|nr:MAG: hypothetical protein COU17_02975 [Candidatus Kaiserbacteria bacterium CG10_big_fil_rev_8_21_14_0_10_49_17]